MQSAHGDGLAATLARSARSADLLAVVREPGERLPALTERGHGRRVREYDT
ncbi:hypothetical protein [Streptomyces violaceorubidus]|uniref:hypothetical protein n=1 Tax=Streptomyces violaceorubidus TaxID=284042 RepID=UPI000ACEB5D9|nr:hypothetical protein [Streptomyces violaceorubidus]